MSQKLEKQYSPHPEFRFWLYDPEGDGMVYYRSAEDRDADAEEAISGYLDDGYWSEEVENVCVGEVTHIASEVNRVNRPDDDQIDEDGCDESGRYWNQDIDYICNYELLPIPKTQDTP